MPFFLDRRIHECSEEEGVRVSLSVCFAYSAVRSFGSASAGSEFGPRPSFGLRPSVFGLLLHVSRRGRQSPPNLFPVPRIVKLHRVVIIRQHPAVVGRRL